ncbi:copper homeostasis protein CutC [Cohnella endophytica]|uniref:PF03932 family protein CutC n=1 Tax=Cohnella endophytica TaxID=2419778 RepID=A0A494XGM4_9BACL|nr:copper homeostasis protein CutC [Cohnella endophytica]RKP49885.1 copper homeostasis protein CutC [Cohnella endophytica]
MILEVIATTVTDALAAVEGGADRIELVTGLAEGGLTPSYGLIEQVAYNVNVPVQVMVRPHGQSFCYGSSDVKTMLRDIRIIREIRDDIRSEQGDSHPRLGVVLGCITRDRKIDMVVLETLLDEVGDMDVTFHRAFDDLVDQESAYDTLTRYSSIRRVLTSGGKPSVLDAVGTIRRLVELSRDSHVAILAGSGLTLEALPEFWRDTGIREIHFGTGVRGARGIAGAVDSDKVRAIKRIG